MGREWVEAPCSCPVGTWLARRESVSSPYRLVCRCTWVFYDRLLELLRLPVWHSGTPSELDLGADALLAWRWEHPDGAAYVLVNYAPHATRLPAGVLPAGLTNWFTEEGVGDLLGGYEYVVAW